MRAVLVHDRAGETRLARQTLAALRGLLPGAEVHEQADDAPVRLAGYELTVSTSLSAGQRVMLPAGTPHVCYDGSLRDFTGGPESQGISTFVAASRRLAERLQQLTGRANPVITPPVDTRFFRPETEPRGAFYLVVAETCTADDV